ncbi:MAG TPA: hypothetical protein VKE94_14925 [Gemmataceae bacterium]|nr:hypothetical protein [Gemmataceae bacterium]
MFVFLVHFEGRTEPDRFVLADRKLFEEFTAWLSDPKSAKGGWYYEHDEGSLTAISFQQVASIMVRPQPNSRIEPPPPSSAEHFLKHG